MRLFAFDVDGTLINGNIKLNELLKNRLNEILKNGDAIAIASGRPYKGIMQILNQLDSGLKFCLCANGNLVTDINGKELYITGLKMKDYYDFVDNHQDIFKNKTSNIYCYTTHRIAYLKSNAWIKFERKANDYFEGVDLRKNRLPDDYHILKFMIASLPKRSKNFDEKHILESEKEKYNILRTSPYFLEFINKNSDKADAVEFLRNYLNIEKESVYTFGDSGNDVKMIKDFNGVAMGNASEECKRVAKFVTKSVDENGVIYALDNFVKF